jgi:Rha family phage regulatory protein
LPAHIFINKRSVVLLEYIFGIYATNQKERSVQMTSELEVKQMNSELTIDSREVAEMTGKAHDKLLRDIRGYIKVLDQSPKLETANFFIESTYENNNNQSYPCYLLTRKGCDMVANKMTGEKGILFTATYVTKFEEMENQIKSNVPQISREQELVLAIYSGGLDAVEATKELTQLKVVEAIKPLEEKIESDKPFVEFGTQVSKSADSIEVGDFAKIVRDENINVGRNRLYEWLRDNKYLMKGNKPYQSKIEQGLFEVVEYTYNTPYKKNCIGTKVLITGKGQIYLVEKLREEFH